MPRFPIKNTQITENKAKITGDSFKHISKVLRLKLKDEIILFDESFNEHKAKIVSLNQRDLEVEIFETIKNEKESLIDINLFQSVPKGSKMDLIVQKTTELGVNSITPIRSERSIVQDTRKSERWSKIVLESCKQCGRSKMPKINSFIDFSKISEHISKNHLNLLFYENEVTNLKNFLSNQNTDYQVINIVIGPEGGFTEAEINYATAKGIHIVGLGPRILRVETASIAAVSAIQFHFGDL